MSDFLDSQFLDIIEYSEDNPKILIWKFRRRNNKNDIMQGSKIIVRENQLAFFICRGEIQDILETGTHTITKGNLPILSSLENFAFKFNSPLACEVYFLKTNQFYGNKWATKTAVIKKDKDVGPVRVRGFGNFSFRVSDPMRFMHEIFINQALTFTYDIVEFLKSVVAEAFTVAVSAADVSIFNLQSDTVLLSNLLSQIANEIVKEYGIVFPKIMIEGITLPEEVENMIDEQTGVGLASDNIDNYLKYKTANAIGNSKYLSSESINNLLKQNTSPPIVEEKIYVDAERVVNDYYESKESEIPDLKKLPINSMESSEENKVENNNNKNDLLKTIKNLFDEGILTEEEFNNEKEKILNSNLPWF